MNIGFHTSITPSILDGLKYSHSLGASAAQIFLGATQSSSLKTKQKLTSTDINTIKTFITTHNIVLSVHAIYLLNFCSFPPENKRIKYAQDNLIYDLETADKLGASCVVLHIGTQKTLPRNEAYNNMANNVLYILKSIKTTTKHIKLLLETPAGQGTQIATTIPELAELYNLILNNCKNYSLSRHYVKARCGFCIDTAHIFSSGYAIRMPLGMANYFKEFDKLIGLDNVHLIHLNDSKADLNSRRDIHEGIGDGYIFNLDKIKSSSIPIPITKKDYLQNLNVLLTYSKKYKIPIILETHKAGNPLSTESSLYSQELGLLKSLWTNPNWIIKNPDWSLTHIDITTTPKTPTTFTTPTTPSINTINKINTKVSKPSTHTIKKTKKLKGPKQAIINNTITAAIPFTQYPANVIIINKLQLIRDYYIKVEKDTIRSLAYGKAILALKNFPEEIVNSNQLLGIKNIGPKIIKKIDEYLHTGTMNIFKERDILNKLDNINKQLKYNITSILGFGEKKALQLKKQGINTYHDLLDAVKNNKIQLNDKEHLGVKYHEDLIQLIPRTETSNIYTQIQKCLKQYLITEELHIELAGSYPSGKQHSKDIDILIFSDRIHNHNELRLNGLTIINELLNQLKACNIVIEEISKGYGMLMCLVRGVSSKVVRHLDIRLLPRCSEVFGRMFFTSGKDFNQLFRQRAKSMGYKLNEFDLTYIRSGKSVFTDAEKEKLKEEDIFDKLGYSFIPITKRRG
jgi:deoxyribonuclease IV